MSKLGTKSVVLAKKETGPTQKKPSGLARLITIEVTGTAKDYAAMVRRIGEQNRKLYETDPSRSLNDLPKYRKKKPRNKRKRNKRVNK